jgi:hypothetical protein
MLQRLSMVATVCALSTAACSSQSSAGTPGGGDGSDAGVAVDGGAGRPPRDASSAADSHGSHESFDAKNSATSDAPAQGARDAVADASADEIDAKSDAVADARAGETDAKSDAGAAGHGDAASVPPDAAVDAGGGNTNWSVGLPVGAVNLTYTVTQPNCSVTEESSGTVMYESVTLTILVTGTNPGSLQVTVGSGTADPATMPVGGEGTWSYETTPAGPNYDYVEYAGTIDGLSMTVSYGASFGGQQDFLTCSDLHGTAP